MLIKKSQINFCDFFILNESILSDIDKKIQ